MKTAERILETSRELFNALGEASVSNSRLAEAAGVAPGNLWYHFRTREALLAAHLSAAETAFRAALADADSPRPLAERYVAFTLGTLSVMWRWRFLMAPETTAGVQVGRSGLAGEQFATLRRLIAAFRLEGWVADPTTDLDALAVSIWMVVRFWPDHLRGFEGVTTPDPSRWSGGFDLQRELLRLALTPNGREALSLAEAEFSGRIYPAMAASESMA